MTTSEKTSSGNAPAHKSVLTNEVLQYLDPQPGKVYVDATFGVGGHTKAILEAEPGCSVIAFDWDREILDTYGIPLQEKYGNRLEIIWGNFSRIFTLLKKHKVTAVDGVLADFGTSQVQITQRPGFSLFRDTPLDMRMSPAHQRTTAEHVLKSATYEELAEIFWVFGGEQKSRKIARAIVADRGKKPFTSTKQLADLIERLLGHKKGYTHPATRVFQALRIYVNRELDNISALLANVMRVVRPGGRIVCISFHSLEDRIVKQFFKDKEMSKELTILTPRVVTPTQEEIAENISSRSARLRAAQIT